MEFPTLTPTLVTHEASLLERARELDARALAQIHDQLYPELYRFALYRTGETAVAEDITSEAFVRLLDALRAGRAPHSTLRGWLFGVAAHLVADHFRRAPRDGKPLSEWFVGDESPAAEVEQRLRQGALRAALNRLTTEQQNVLALRFGDGFSVEQTAEALGKSVTAVKALQFRAVEALRRALAPQEMDHD
ncbi:MAG: sigma-70 family RNA polymerase sigma factor [Anaerolineales bacterium]